MKMYDVVSTNVNRVGYDRAGKKLVVKFNSDQVYIYSGVPREIYTGLRKSESIGVFLHENIIDKYPFVRM